MLFFPHLKLFAVFSTFPLIIGNKTRYTKTPVDIHHDAVDGHQFIKKIIHGEKISERPGLLLFTAPYKLCDGGCNGSDARNFAMVFPLFIGKKGVKTYKTLYHQDHKKVHSLKPNAPFKKKTKRPPFTICSTNKRVPVSLNVSEKTSTAASCPLLIPGLCYKKRNEIMTSYKAENTVTESATQNKSTNTQELFMEYYNECNGTDCFGVAISSRQT